MSRKIRATLIGFSLFVGLVGLSFLVDFAPGQTVGKHFFTFFLEMARILPCAFLLIGLFEVWVKPATIEKQLGHGAGARSYVWAILLASATVGPAYVSFPVAAALARKGARLSVIFTYVGAAAICRIPMTTFEASFLGAKFTVIRWAVSIPLIIASSALLGRYLSARGFVINDGPARQ